MIRLIVIALLLISLKTTAQEIRVNTADISKEMVDDYNQRAADHTNKDSIYRYYNRALIIAQEIKYKEGKVTAYKGLIKLHEDDEEVFERLKYCLMLSSFLEKEGTINELAGSYYILGDLYYGEELNMKAADVLEKIELLNNVKPSLLKKSRLLLVKAYKHSGNLDDALVIARRLEDMDGLSVDEKVSLYKEKAEIYHELKAFKEELGTYSKLDGITRGSKYSYLTPVIWNNIGYSNKYTGQLEASKKAFNKVIQTAGSKDTELLGTAYFNKGLIYQNQRKRDSALYCFDQARKFQRKSGNWEQYAESLNMEAMIYYRSSDQFNALKKVESAIELSKDKELYPTLAKSYEIDSYIQQDLFEYERALESYKKFLSIRDSLTVEERAKERSKLFDRYRVEEFEKRMRLIWVNEELEYINMERLKAEKDAQEQRFQNEQQAAKLKIYDLETKALKDKAKLDLLALREQELQLKNQENELALIQRDNDLKELALERERLEAAKKEREIELLDQRNEAQKQKQMREQEEFDNKLRFVTIILLFIVLVLFGILIAYRQLRKRKQRIEEQNEIIASSKMEIEKEKEKSDGLLLNILPTAVAEELKSEGSSKPRRYDEVSVGFTDFSEFTRISEQLSPEELVQKLDAIFLEFDRIVEKYGLQRIKTIGDAYMFASGLPDYLEDHATKCVQASLEMRDYISKYNDRLNPNDPAWKIRIGVNSGPVVAGVIGIKKFAYDIWGDTVNTASRMESSGEVGKVNISGSTHDLIKTKFSTEYRGKIAAKNKGDIDMYFVERVAG